MTTFKDLQNIVLNTLHGQTLDQEERCALSNPLNSSDISFVVDDVTQLSRGVIEIDSELMWVKGTDTNSATVTLSPFGRGYGETTAATHAQNAMVVNNPRYPRQYVKDAINDTLGAIYPELFQVKTSETNTASATQMTYPLPADCDFIIDVSWQAIGPSKIWLPAKRYKLNFTSDTTAFPTGKSVDIFDAMVPGRTIKVTYMAAPGSLTNDTDTLVSTGLGEGVRDILTYGACARLVQSAEVARLHTTSVEQSDRAMLSQPGAATQASRAYLQLYQLRLADERERLMRLYPGRTHFTR